jgi:hypothetical protein
MDVWIGTSDAFFANGSPDWVNLYIPMDEENSGSVTLEGRYNIYQDLDEMVDLPARFEGRCQRKLDKMTRLRRQIIHALASHTGFGTGMLPFSLT